MTAVTKVWVEGWTQLSHSYALVNEYQLSVLSRDPRLKVFHREGPVYDPAWRNVPSVIPAAVRAVNATIPPWPPGESPDVLYRIGFPWQMYSAAPRTLVFGTCEYHGGERDWVGRDGRRESAAPDEVEIVTPSRWSAGGFHAWGVAPERVHVLPHGFDPTIFKPAAPAERAQVRSRLGIPADAFVFFNLGAMTWNKGVDLLLAAFALHVERYPGAVLVLKTLSALYGDFQGAAWRDAVQWAPKLVEPDIRAAIRRVDRPMTSADIARLYQASDAYVSPYRAEGFNLPVLEAMGCGLPVAVTAGGATDDFCPPSVAVPIAAEPRSGADGAYLEPQLASVVAALETLRFDTPARQRMASAAFAHASQRYTWSAVGQSLADLLVGHR